MTLQGNYSASEDEGTFQRDLDILSDPLRNRVKERFLLAEQTYVYIVYITLKPQQNQFVNKFIFSLIFQVQKLWNVSMDKKTECRF